MSGHSTNDPRVTGGAQAALAGTHLAFVGAGVMAEAMIAGLLDRGLVAADQIVASHPRADRREILHRKWGIGALESNAEAAATAGLVFLTVKPQALTGVANQLHGRLAASQVVISVVALLPS